MKGLLDVTTAYRRWFKSLTRTCVQFLLLAFYRMATSIAEWNLSCLQKRRNENLTKLMQVQQQFLEPVSFASFLFLLSSGLSTWFCFGAGPQACGSHAEIYPRRHFPSCYTRQHGHQGTPSHGLFLILFFGLRRLDTSCHLQNCTVLLFNDIIVLAIKKKNKYQAKSGKVTLRGSYVWEDHASTRPCSSTQRRILDRCCLTSQERIHRGRARSCR